jgi:hypothetical protein
MHVVMNFLFVALKFLSLKCRPKDPLFYSSPKRLEGAEGEVHFTFNSECYFISNGNLNAFTLCMLFDFCPIPMLTF